MKIMVAPQDTFNDEGRKRKKPAKEKASKKPRRNGRGFRRTSDAMNAQEVERENMAAASAEETTVQPEQEEQPVPPEIPAISDTPESTFEDTDAPGQEIEPSFVPPVSGAPDGPLAGEEYTQADNIEELKQSDGSDHDESSIPDGEIEDVGQPDAESPKRKGLHLRKKEQEVQEKAGEEQEEPVEEEQPKKGKRGKDKKVKPPKEKKSRKAKAAALVDGEDVEDDIGDDDFDEPVRVRRGSTLLAIGEAIVAAAIFAVAGNQVGTIILTNMVSKALGG